MAIRIKAPYLKQKSQGSLSAKKTKSKFEVQSTQAASRPTTPTQITRSRTPSPCFALQRQPSPYDPLNNIALKRVLNIISETNLSKHKRFKTARTKQKTVVPLHKSNKSQVEALEQTKPPSSPTFYQGYLSPKRLHLSPKGAFGRNSPYRARTPVNRPKSSLSGKSVQSPKVFKISRKVKPVRVSAKHLKKHLPESARTPLVRYWGLGHKNTVTCLDLSSDKLYSGGSDYSIIEWNMPKQNPYFFESNEEDRKMIRPEQNLKSHKRAVTDIKLIDPKTLVSSSKDCCIKLWNLKNSSLTCSLKAHSSPVNSIELISPKTLVSGGSDSFVKLWDIESFTCSKTFKVHSNSIQKLLKQDRSTFLSASLDSTCKLLDVRCRSTVAVFRGHAGPVTALCLWDRNSFITAGEDFKIKVRLT